MLEYAFALSIEFFYSHLFGDNSRERAENL